MGRFETPGQVLLLFTGAALASVGLIFLLNTEVNHRKQETGTKVEGGDGIFSFISGRLSSVWTGSGKSGNTSSIDDVIVTRSKRSLKSVVYATSGMKESSGDSTQKREYYWKYISSNNKTDNTNEHPEESDDYEYHSKHKIRHLQEKIESLDDDLLRYILGTCRHHVGPGNVEVHREDVLPQVNDVSVTQNTLPKQRTASSLEPTDKVKGPLPLTTASSPDLRESSFRNDVHVTQDVNPTQNPDNKTELETQQSSFHPGYSESPCKQKMSVCYGNNDVLLIIALTCAVNFTFFFLVMACVYICTRNERKLGSSQNYSLLESDMLSHCNHKMPLVWKPRSVSLSDAQEYLNFLSVDSVAPSLVNSKTSLSKEQEEYDVTCGQKLGYVISYSMDNIHISGQQQC